MSNKKVQVANFNVVFLEEKEEAPLLKYFDNIVVPALQSGIKKESGDATFLFTDVEVMEDKEQGYVLAGKIVKKTIIEIKSDLDDNEELIEKDEKYSTAPFSAFVIYLRNHRMLFVPNQKGSPNIKNFSTTVKFVLAEYIKRHNKKQEKKEALFPFPAINIVGLPLRSNIEEALKEVVKINKVTLRFYPLNGDQEFCEMFGELMSDMRKMVDSPKSDVILKSPGSISGVIELIEKSDGTVEPIIDVTYPDKTKGRITQDTISERMEISFSGDNIQKMDEVVGQGRKIKSIGYVSKGNQEIYNKHESKIIKFISRS